MTAIQFNTITSEYLQALVAPATPQTRMSVTEGADGRPDFHQALRLSGVLQTTIELDKLIALFSEQLKPIVHQSSIVYRNEEFGISLRHGRGGTHSCSYRLVINEEFLGELSLTRAKPFSLADTKALEYLLCTLVYPLRNALLYRKALLAAHKDPLTGVNNRSTLNETLRREIDLSRRYNRPLSLIVLDIDRFKNINDTFGHATGDTVIKTLAERLCACVRSSDILFRYGGEEFVVVLSNTGIQGAALLAERVRKNVEKAQCRNDHDVFGITVSLGVATLGEGEAEKALFARADQALYLAKSNGRNRIELAPEAARVTSNNAAII